MSKQFTFLDGDGVFNHQTELDIVGETFVSLCITDCYLDDKYSTEWAIPNYTDDTFCAHELLYVRNGKVYTEL